MSNPGKITSLKFSILSDKRTDIITNTTTNFEFAGSISIEDARNLINNFKEVYSDVNNLNQNIHSITDEHKINYSPDSSSDDENIPITELASSRVNSENNGYQLTNTVIGNYILNNNIRNEHDTMCEAWNSFTSFLIEPSRPITIHGKRIRFYKIYFPKVSHLFSQIKFLAPQLPIQLINHGYPVCSCPAYYYKSYYHNNKNGACKHIIEALSTLQLNFYNIDWNNRPNNLPSIMKENGIEHYEWVPLT